MFKYLIALVFFFSLSLAGFPQEKIDISSAFSKSYSSESEKNYPQAINDLLAVYDEKSYEMNIRIGWLYYYSEKYEESLKYYSNAIKIKPQSIESKLGYVLPASALGNWDQVLDQYLEILKIDDKNSTVNYFTGLIYYNKSEFEKAEKYFEKVYTLYSFNYDTAIILALTKQKLKKISEAKELFNKALLFYPGDQTALDGLKQME